MILASVIDAGAPVARLNEALDGLNVKGFKLSHKPGRRGGVTGTLVSVELDEDGRRRRQWRDFIEIVESSTLPAKVVERACAVCRPA